MSFSEQRSTLLSRKQELDEGDASITNLIDILDKRKDEAILRTFKGVSHHFTEVFAELVPTGQGKMIITKSSSESNNNTVVETFTGVQIKVSFRGEGDSYLMQQLSGGQKALVALAFIFAIQRCDPAPFYLFDEIDQALDSTHRAAVAALIRRQANIAEHPAQFITQPFDQRWYVWPPSFTESDIRIRLVTCIQCHNRSRWSLLPILWQRRKEWGIRR